MAKKKAKPDGINKSAAIRELLAKNSHTPVKEIVSALGERGIHVDPKHVYLIKSKTRHQTQRENRQRAVEATAKAGLANPVELILDVRRVAERAGGIRQLKRLVDLLAE